MLELSSQGVREHSMLDLIDCSAALVSARFKASPNKHCTSDVIASQDFGGKLPPKTLRLDAGVAALASRNAR